MSKYYLCQQDYAKLIVLFFIRKYKCIDNHSYNNSYSSIYNPVYNIKKCIPKIFFRLDYNTYQNNTPYYNGFLSICHIANIDYYQDANRCNYNVKKVIIVWDKTNYLQNHISQNTTQYCTYRPIKAALERLIIGLLHTNHSCNSRKQ